MRKIVILTGATASGKSSVALKLAKAMDADIVNADSMQVYKEIPVLTSSPIEKQGVNHFLYQIIAGNEGFSVAKWLSLVDDYLKDTTKSVVIVGGTAMYIRTLLDGLSLIPDVSREEVGWAVKFLEEEGQEAFYAKLCEIDSLVKGNINPNDTQRLLRAFTVVSITGKSIFEWRKEKQESVLISYKRQVIKLWLNPPREELYRNCDERFLQILKDGAEDEVKNIMTLNYPASATIYRAIGVPEIAAYLKGEIDRKQMITLAQTSTRNYAKRQLTWFRNNFTDFAPFTSVEEIYNKVI